MRKTIIILTLLSLVSCNDMKRMAQNENIGNYTIEMLDMNGKVYQIYNVTDWSYKVGGLKAITNDGKTIYLNGIYKITKN